MQDPYIVYLLTKVSREADDRVAGVEEPVKKLGPTPRVVLAVLSTMLKLLLLSRASPPG